jgi:glycosyltransferase involved in cell wall biosynthesis
MKLLNVIGSQNKLHNMSDIHLNSTTVLIVCPTWDRTFINTNLGKLITRLTQEGFVIKFYCQSSGEDDNFRLNFPNAELLNFRHSGGLKGLGLVRFLINTLRLLIFNRFDLVLWSYVGYMENVFFALLGVPYTLKSDSAKILQPKSFFGKLKYWLFIKYPIKKANHVLVETVEVGKRLKKVVDRDVYLFPNGVPIKQFKKFELQFESQTNKNRGLYILYTGRIMREKGVDLLLKSFSEISYKYPKWKMYIVGSVWDEKYEEKLKKFVLNNNLSNNVFFLPFKTGVELYELYYFAEIFVLPSRREGLANRITEAMFFKNAIVAFDVNQTKSLVTEQTGELVPALDVTGFSNKIEFLINNKEIRKNKGKQARSVIENKHNDDELFPNLFKKIGLH